MYTFHCILCHKTIALKLQYPIYSLEDNNKLYNFGLFHIPKYDSLAISIFHSLQLLQPGVKSTHAANQIAEY